MRFPITIRRLHVPRLAGAAGVSCPLTATCVGGPPMHGRPALPKPTIACCQPGPGRADHWMSAEARRQIPVAFHTWGVFGFWDFKRKSFNI